ncbi:hypothetical protein VN97_g11572, partial [Penicillium thymicola]
MSGGLSVGIIAHDLVCQDCHMSTT